MPLSKKKKEKAYKLEKMTSTMHVSGPKDYHFPLQKWPTSYIMPGLFIEDIFIL